MTKLGKPSKEEIDRVCTNAGARNFMYKRTAPDAPLDLFTVFPNPETEDDAKVIEHGVDLMKKMLCFDPSK